jgi:hypothetical protein
MCCLGHSPPGFVVYGGRINSLGDRSCTASGPGYSFKLHSKPATPAFAGQTGQPCSRCHSGPAGGKDLTEFGKELKANGIQIKKQASAE